MVNLPLWLRTGIPLLLFKLKANMRVSQIISLYQIDKFTSFWTLITITIDIFLHHTRLPNNQYCTCVLPLPFLFLLLYDYFSYINLICPFYYYEHVLLFCFEEGISIFCQNMDMETSCFLENGHFFDKIWA